MWLNVPFLWKLQMLHGEDQQIQSKIAPWALTMCANAPPWGQVKEMFPRNRLIIANSRNAQV